MDRAASGENMEIVEIVIALTGVVTVLVSLGTVMTTARRSSFEELRQVVDTLQRSLDDEKLRRKELEVAFIDERLQRMKIENWARKLVRQLQVANIVPAEMDE